MPPEVISGAKRNPPQPTPLEVAQSHSRTAGRTVAQSHGQSARSPYVRPADLVQDRMLAQPVHGLGITCAVHRPGNPALPRTGCRSGIRSMRMNALPDGRHAEPCHAHPARPRLASPPRPAWRSPQTRPPHRTCGILGPQISKETVPSQTRGGGSGDQPSLSSGGPLAQHLDFPGTQGADRGRPA